MGTGVAPSARCLIGQAYRQPVPCVARDTDPT